MAAKPKFQQPSADSMDALILQSLNQKKASTVKPPPTSIVSNNSKSSISKVHDIDKDIPATSDKWDDDLLDLDD